MASRETTSIFFRTEIGVRFASGSLEPHLHQHLLDLLMEEAQALPLSLKAVAFSEDCPSLEASRHLRTIALT